MDKIRLEYEMKRKGITVGHLCERIGINKATYYRKCKGQSEFTCGEIQKIIDLVGLKTPVGVFFQEKVS